MNENTLAVFENYKIRRHYDERPKPGISRWWILLQVLDSAAGLSDGQKILE